MSSLEDCYGKGLLKKTGKQPDLAKKDLRRARFFLKETTDLLELNKKVMASISLYNAFFHIARALLFNDGIKERSHYCIARYIEDKYTRTKTMDGKFLNAFETMMSIRHNTQYSTEEVEIEEDLAELYNISEEFLSAVERIIQ